MKLELFTMNEASDHDFSEIQINPMNPNESSDINKCEVVIRNVDPSLLKAISLADKKLTRLTLVAAMGFMVAWMPFCILCFWEAATPPTDIPTSKSERLRENHKKVPLMKYQVLVQRLRE